MKFGTQLKIKRLYRKNLNNYNLKHFGKLVSKAWKEDPLIKELVPNPKERRQFLYAYKKFIVALGF